MEKTKRVIDSESKQKLILNCYSIIYGNLWYHEKHSATGSVFFVFDQHFSDFLSFERVSSTV